MKNQIIKTLVFQYILGGIYILGAGLWDISVMLSALVGCAAVLLSNTYFSVRMLKVREDDDAARFLGYAYRSEIGKWVMMAVVLMLAFTTDYSWDPVFLFAGFGLIVLSGWFAPILIKGY